MKFLQVPQKAIQEDWPFVGGFQFPLDVQASTDLLHLKVVFIAFLRVKVYLEHFAGAC